MKTPLFAQHVALGARMAPFGAWDMPIQYSGIIEEHLHTRASAGLFDICHMGELMVEGATARAELDRLITCDIAALPPGRCRYGFLLNDNGGVIDDCITYCFADARFMVVVNSATAQADAHWISARLSPATRMTDVSAQTGKLDLQGPLTRAVLQPFVPADFATLKYFHFIETAFNGVPVILSRTGYTGEYGYEIYVAAEQVAAIWECLLADPRVKPVGLGARDTLRLECALPLYGHELNEARTPVSAGLLFALRMSKAFIGKAAVERDLEFGTAEVLVGLRLSGRQTARNGQRLKFQGADAGEVTSGSYAPSLGHAIALAYVPSACKAVGTALRIDTGRKDLEAVVCATPFYTAGTARQ